MLPSYSYLSRSALLDFKIIGVIWQQVLKLKQREQVSNPFWLVAISGTKLPKGLKLVQQNNSATQNIRDYVFNELFLRGAKAGFEPGT